jgi:hypothetical protein
LFQQAESAGVVMKKLMVLSAIGAALTFAAASSFGEAHGPGGMRGHEAHGTHDRGSGMRDHGRGERHGFHEHRQSRIHGDVFIGAPFFWQPPVYIEQPPVYINPEPGYWYYCPDPPGYYPYVQYCPIGWLQVVPDSAHP